MSDDALFDLPAGAVIIAEPVEQLSAGRRLTLRQSAELARGVHPLTKRRQHAEAAPWDDRTADGRRCGNCWWRMADAIGGVAGSYPKCTVNDGARITRSAASDCRAWWPACADHSYGDPTVSADAARYVPSGAP